MKKVIMGIGIPGSGKTTILKEMATRQKAVYVCPDDIRFELTGDASNQTRNADVWELTRKRTVLALQTGKDVVVDATFVNPSQRLDFLRFVREVGAQRVEGVFVDLPLEVAKERNAKRERKVPEDALERMCLMLHEDLPHVREGFDMLFVYDEQHKMKEITTREAFLGESREKK